MADQHETEVYNHRGAYRGPDAFARAIDGEEPDEPKVVMAHAECHHAEQLAKAMAIEALRAAAMITELAASGEEPVDVDDLRHVAHHCREALQALQNPLGEGHAHG